MSRRLMLIRTLSADIMPLPAFFDHVDVTGFEFRQKLGTRSAPRSVCGFEVRIVVERRQFGRNLIELRVGRQRNKAERLSCLELDSPWPREPPVHREGHR